MNNSIFKNIKKIISAIIQNRLLMILVRAIIICIIFFYIIPKFYPLLLKDIITKIEVSILTIILLEFIILKMSLTNKKEDAKEVEKKDTNIDKDFLTGKLDYAIKNRPCFLFLHVKSVSMNELLSKQNYTRLSIDPAQDDKIKLFDNFYNVIIGCKIDEFKNPAEAILIISKYQYEYGFALDKEICIMAMLIQLKETTKKQLI